MACRDQFLSTLETATVEAAKEAGNVDLTTFDANNDISAQLGHVQTCAAGGYDAVIVNLVNTDSAPEIVDLAGDMKVVFVNRLPSDESVLKDNVMYCGSRESDAGTMQGEYLAKYFKDQGKTEANGIMIMGTLGLSHTVARTDYAKKALEDGGIKVNWVFEDTADFDRAKAMDKMTQVLGDANKKFDFIVCNANDMALGCIEAIKAASGEVTVPIVGIDGGATGCKAIQDGETDELQLNPRARVFATAKVRGASRAPSLSFPAKIKRSLRRCRRLLFYYFILLPCLQQPRPLPVRKGRIPILRRKPGIGYCLPPKCLRQ